jgi:hypothetical protein
MHCREGNKPQPDDQCAEGKHPLACSPIFRMRQTMFAGSLPACAEYLSANPYAKQKGAKKKGKPCHGHPFYSSFYTTGKRFLRVMMSAIDCSSEEAFLHHEIKT